MADDWQVAGWLADFMSHSCDRWLAGWMAGKMHGWQAGRLAGWQAGWLARWMAGRVAGWMAGRFPEIWTVYRLVHDSREGGACSEKLPGSSTLSGLGDNVLRYPQTAIGSTNDRRTPSTRGLKKARKPFFSTTPLTVLLH